jgi:hypothetical protein
MGGNKKIKKTTKRPRKMKKSKKNKKISNAFKKKIQTRKIK